MLLSTSVASKYLPCVHVTCTVTTTSNMPQSLVAVNDQAFRPLNTRGGTATGKMQENGEHSWNGEIDRIDKWRCPGRSCYLTWDWGGMPMAAQCTSIQSCNCVKPKPWWWL